MPDGSGAIMYPVFERFTDRARRVLVFSQEEARLLNHGFIGTEHILLGLIHENEGIAATALQRLGIELEDAREWVEETIGLSTTPASGSPQFTPRAKKVLELSLREALRLDHNYIGTEHMLLGILREGEGVAAQLLVSHGADLVRVRETVIELLAANSGEATASERTRGPFSTGPREYDLALSLKPARVVACSFCGRHPPDSGRLVQGRGAFICERCVEEWGDRFARDETEGGDEPPEPKLYEIEKDDGEEQPESPSA